MSLPSDFDWARYLELNDDVEKVYKTQHEAEQHYLKDGQFQQRLYKTENVPNDFDWELYLAFNNDVYISCKTKTAAIMHYERHGYSECRYYKLEQAEIPEDFNWILYLHNNPSLNLLNKNKIEATYHYYKKGKRKNLSYEANFLHVPDDFNWEMYLLLNSDLNLITTELEAKVHYENYGYMRKKPYKIPKGSIPDDFNWIAYTELNTDVKQVYNSENRAKYHYYITGKNEGRIYKFNHTPKDFDWEFYIKLNPTISEGYKVNEYTAKLHYDLFGKSQDLPYYCNFENIPEDFDYNDYLKYNEDLIPLCYDEMSCKIHYNNYGIYQCRKYKLEQIIYNESNDYINYPFLFHKYLLQLTPESKSISYDVMSKDIESCNIPLITHIHCYNLNKFTHYFDNYINKIKKYSKYIIVTYSVGEPDLDDMSLTFIHCLNQGMDIGGKFVVIDYLKSRNIKYDFILFLHSKTDDYVRQLYCEPLINNLDSIVQSFDTNDEIGIYLPPLVYMGDYATVVYKDHFLDPKNITSKWNFGNSLYVNDLDKYMNLDKSTYLFPEGNCFICNHKIAETLYGDILLYNLLNTKLTFDAVWVKSFYTSRNFTGIGNSIYEIFDYFKKYNKSPPLYPNNIAWGAGHEGHADNMFEHSFERLVFKVVKKTGFLIKIMHYKDDEDYIDQLDHYTYTINELLYS